ncbi:MAG: CDP-alcohol phosphatidyltransferase family protein [bacterium]|nr:CDP-alcohol phosphatidyltransferase family protein [bacterium]
MLKEETPPTFTSGPQALQWKRLKRLKLEGARLEYLTKVTIFDRIFALTILPLFPRSISPNRITLFRFVSIPFVLFLLLSEYNLAGTILFALSALSDALDGALARTEHRITKWGIVADPIADKLLIGSVALLVVWKYVGWHLTLAIVLIELVLAGSAYFRYRGKLMPAKTIGKMKMILQCFGIGFILLYGIVPSPVFLIIGQYILYLAIIFGLGSLFVYRSI